MKTTLTIIAAGVLGLYALSAAAFTCDGENITGDFAQAEWKVFQDTPPNWGVERFLASMYATTNATALLLGVGAELEWENFTLFFDTDPATGSNVYPDFSGDLDGEARARFTGMTFDTNFTPDKAITFTHWQDGEPDEGCHLGWHDIVTRTSTSWGKYENTLSPYVFTNDSVIFAFVSAGFPGDTNWVHEWDEGFELSIPFEWLMNTTNEVKIMAQIGSWSGEWVANQTLPPVHNDESTTNSASADRRYDLIPGFQYMTVAVPVTVTGSPLYVVASQSQTKLFAASSVNQLSAIATGGTPGYTFEWNMGNGFSTNAQSFDYRYPVDGLFTTTVVVSDSADACITTSVGAVTVMPATFVDGIDIPADFAGKGTNVTQDTESNWGQATVPGGGSELDRLFAFSEDEKLYVGVCGNLATGSGDRVFAVFIDCDYAIGTNVLTGITAGDPQKMLNLEGLTFDETFTPDKAIIFSVNQPHDYWVDYYELNTNDRVYLAEKTEWSSIFDPYQRSYLELDDTLAIVAAFNDMNTAANPANATNGFECLIDIDALYRGITLPFTQTTVRIQALLYNHETGYVANQSLPGIHSSSSGYGAAASVNYDNVSGLQYVEIIGPVIPEPAYALFALLSLCALARSVSDFQLPTKA